MIIPLCFNPRDDPSCRGEFADVWKGRHEGKEVAAKVLRVYERDNLEEIRKVGCW